MTYAPQPLKDLAAYWVDHKGVSLGIVGDTAHQQKGVSYHLGEDDLAPGAYSAKLERDVAGLSNAASAIDLGRLNGRLKDLRQFSAWLVEQCKAGAPGTSDIREVIYCSLDGSKVLHWDNFYKVAHIGGTGTGWGDDSHKTHTHISAFRDSELRDKIVWFRPYFEEDMDAKRFKPVAVCAVQGGGALYADPDRTTLISPNFAGGPTIQLYALPSVPVEANGKAALAMIRLDRLSGPAEDLYDGYVGVDLISDIRLIDEPPAETVTIVGRDLSVTKG